jgi:thiol-disulfide isomerase/thioredoxin
MGRLQAVRVFSPAAAVCSGIVFIAGCNEDAKKAAASAARERSEVVQATGTMPVLVVPTTPSSATAAHPSVQRRLCEGQLAKPGHDVPKRSPSRKSALGASPLLPSIPSGKWTWVNLWAAWCAPCKEEMPRLRTFAARLGQAGKDVSLVFISLDDDERQLEQFLGAQPEDGVRATYWLREGHERDEWLLGIGLVRDPQLPAQLLIDPHGKVRCTVIGAVEEQDFAEIAAIVSST